MSKSKSEINKKLIKKYSQYEFNTNSELNNLNASIIEFVKNELNNSIKLNNKLIKHLQEK